MEAIFDIFNELTSKGWKPVVLGVTPVRQEIDFMDGLINVGGDELIIQCSFK